jgi:Anti-sigma-K factor rskA
MVRDENHAARSAKASSAIPFWMWSVIAGLLIFTLYTSWEAIHLDKQVAETYTHANEETAKQNQLKESFALVRREATILTDPHSVKILLVSEDKNLPQLKALWHPKLGIIVSGQGVPLPQANRTLQLWLIPKAPGAKPIASLTWRPDAEGNFMLLVADPPSSKEATKALSITEEPPGGGQTPTTAPLWVGAIS